MKGKQKRKVMSRALARELKLNTRKTKPQKEMSQEHALFEALDQGLES